MNFSQDPHLVVCNLWSDGPLMIYMFMSQGIGIYTLVQPCCTSRLLWRRGRVSDCHPGDPGSIPVRVRSEDIFLHLSHQTEHVRKLRERLDFAYKTAQEAAKRGTAQHKRYYDLKVRSTGVLQPGDRVLVKNVGLRGKQKLADRWERQPYIILSQPNPDIPVFTVKLENSRSKKIRTLHRNLLLPFMGLPLKHTHITEEPRQPSSDDHVRITPVSAPDTDQLMQTDQQPLAPESTGSQSETGEVQRYVIPQRRPRGTPGLTPRSADDSETESQESGARPVRAKRKPGWMNSNEWVMSQPHTFFVNGSQVTYL